MLAVAAVALLVPHLAELGEKVDRLYDRACAMHDEQQQFLREAAAAIRWNRSAWN